ncbi:MAG TPA: glutathione S-transferase family protein [Casimicrobiaceae bacterium]
MLKILGRKTSSNVQKVLWCCGELGLAFEREDVGGPFGRNNEPDYLALNPNGLVPTVIEDGFVLWESNAIVRYLCAAHGKGTLYPTDAKANADADRWMDWQQTSLAPPMGILFRGLLKSPPDAMPTSDLDSAMQRAIPMWRILETQLSRGAFVAGDTLTMADIALGNAVHRWFSLPRQRPDLPQLARWYARLGERPAYRQHVAGV